MTVIGCAGQGFDMSHKLTALRALDRCGDTDLDAKLIGLVGLAFANALDLWGMQRIDLLASLALALIADPIGQGELRRKGRIQSLVRTDLAADIADDAAQLGAQGSQRLVGALELFGMGVPLMFDQGQLAHPTTRS